MSKSTFLQLCSTAAQECGLTDTAMSSVTEVDGMLGMLVGWVASADVETQSRWTNWDFLHESSWNSPTVIGDANISAPPDIGTWDKESFVLDYSTAAYRALGTIEYEVWRATLRNGVKTNQKPTHVVILPNRNLKLEAPPDAIYTLTADYWKRATKMTVNDSYSPIPEEYERVIIARAKIFYAEHDAAGEILAGASTEYDDLLDKLEAKYLPSDMNRRSSENALLVVRPE